MQYLEQKGNIARPNANTSMPKIADVYDEIEPVTPQSKRIELINPKYFSGVYGGSKGIKELWH